MRRVFATLLLTLLVAGAALAWLVLDHNPLIEPAGQLRRSDLATIKALFQRHDPRGQTPDVVQTLQLDETELNRLLDAAVELPYLSGAAIELGPRVARLAVTFSVPQTPFGRYVNLLTELSSEDGQLHIQRLAVGGLPIPAPLADALVRLAHRRLLRDPHYATLAEAITGIHFGETHARLDYRWHPRLFTQIERAGADLLIDPADRMRMLAAAERLDRLVRDFPAGSTQPLVAVLPRLVDADDPDPAAANRAALTALAAYLAGIGLDKLLDSDGSSIRRAPRVLLSLHGRRDFAEHYTISAALAANTGSRLANAIGLSKEEDDARRGSGFSFTDLAANRAGIRLGERALHEAVAVRDALRDARTDADLMPDFRGLPEFMPQAEFARRFGVVGGARYQAEIARIDARIEAHPLLGRL